MKLTRFEPSVPTNFGRFFDDFFTKGFQDNWGTSMTQNMPSVNVSENPENFELEIAAPGLTKEDFKINIENKTLVISVEKQSKEEEVSDDKSYVRREFNYTSFRRSFGLPDSIDIDHIDANYKKGVLKLTLPKLEEAKEKAPRTIEIS